MHDKLQVTMVLSSVGLCEGSVPSMTPDLTSQLPTAVVAQDWLQQNVDICSNNIAAWNTAEIFTENYNNNTKSCLSDKEKSVVASVNVFTMNTKWHWISMTN